MNPLRLRLQNFGVLRDVDLALPEGLVGILGELRNSPSSIDSNGAGKTTLVNALVACLFGPSGRSFADDLTRGEDRMEIELTFEQAGDTYRVRRTFTVKGGAKLDFERALRDVTTGETMSFEGAHAWESLTRESLTATQDLIDRTIGLTRSTFLRSVFLSQEDGSFADGAAKEAKTLLAEAAFGPDPSWSRYAARAGVERKHTEVDLQRIEGRTMGARTVVATKPELEREHETAIEAETVAADTLADREREHVALAAHWQAAREQDARRKGCEAELREAQHAVERLAERTRTVEAAAEQIVQAQARLAELSTAPDTAALERRIEECSAALDAWRSAEQLHAYEKRSAELATSQRSELLARAAEAGRLSDAAANKAAALEQRHDGDTAKCEMCGQPLLDEARARAISSYIEEKQRHRDTALRLHEDGTALTIPAVPPMPEGEAPTAALAAVQGQYRAAREAQAERAQLTERVNQLAASAGVLPSVEEKLAAETLRDAKQAELAALVSVDLGAIEAKGGAVKAALDVAKAALDAARTQLARLDERRVQMVAAEQALAEAAVQEAELHRAIDARVRLEKACGLNGVPALILETSVIPFIETETARVLADLGTPFQVELRTQREKQDGGMADTLEVVVNTATGVSPWRKLSGGEKMRVTVALRIALGRLLASRSGSRSRILVIDEPKWLDAAGIEALVESLRGLLGEFEKIWVVTQSGTTLRDSFDDVITVVKDGDRSRVLDDSLVEVAA